MKYLILLFLFKPSQAVEISYSDLQLLVINCLAEAVSEPEQGQIEVTRTVLKRAKSKRWPDNVSSVILQPRQFSWVGAGIPEYSNADKQKCFTSVTKAVLAGPGDYTHYYAHNKVTPSWAKKLKNVTVIKNHTFGSL